MVVTEVWHTNKTTNKDVDREEEDTEEAREEEAVSGVIKREGIKAEEPFANQEVEKAGPNDDAKLEMS